GAAERARHRGAGAPTRRTARLESGGQEGTRGGNLVTGAATRGRRGHGSAPPEAGGKACSKMRRRPIRGPEGALTPRAPLGIFGAARPLLKAARVFAVPHARVPPGPPRLRAPHRGGLRRSRVGGTTVTLRR